MYMKLRKYYVYKRHIYYKYIQHNVKNERENKSWEMVFYTVVQLAICPCVCSGDMKRVNQSTNNRISHVFGGGDF